ncbi:hypothetical protein EUGRSUZ_F00728 [Eucalyptus grandis]|uniref:Thaumatin-like protein n=2 Tax=Eucalyptus grandis TaxID=71139 RepID=A0A059BLL5_EUCGR|nr:hypothetical protein EUGRSUZ_F00728 [Eucalyptus grandis]
MPVLASKSQLLLLCLLSIGNVLASATVITLQNQCGYTVWPGTLSGNGPTLGDSGFAQPPGGSIQLQAPAGWSGRFWGRTDCSFDGSGTGTCVTGDYPSGAQFTVAAANAGGMDFYDVSLVNGYNVGMGVRATGGTGNCQYAGCLADINADCPVELRVADGSGRVVACKSACEQFKTPDACPKAYSYAYDDATSTCTCTGADYLITFCPGQS